MIHVTNFCENCETTAAENAALRDALRNSEEALSSQSEALDHFEKENAALRERVAALEAAAWDVCDGMYGGNGYEPTPIDLLPEDRRELLHTLLEVCGRATAEGGERCQ